jgi:hypothetical protein
MTTSNRNWRIKPSEFTAHHVERLAREENRSLSNMMEMLLRQSISARLQAQARSNEQANLVSVIRGQEPTR